MVIEKTILFQKKKKKKERKKKGNNGTEIENRLQEYICRNWIKNHT